MPIDFDPPEDWPPYREKCRCERLNPLTRELVERTSRDIYYQSKEEEERIGGLPADPWFRERISAIGGPIMTLHAHFAGMGGRPVMGQGVGGFSLGAACPAGGLCAVTTATYDLPWFTKCLNHYLGSVMQKHTDEDFLLVNCKTPNTFSCWQLNFGKNDSDVLSETCFYNPHIDKNNAKVSSIGTSFGDYEGGGVWVADPKGTTMINFEKDVEGIMSGLVSGSVAMQKTRWVSFWAATNVHAIPPFRKNRVGIVAFSAQTVLRLTDEEQKMLRSVGFLLPKDKDHRFLPKLRAMQTLKGDVLERLTEEQKKEREEQIRQYNVEMRFHQRSCDKMSIALARETALINRMRIQGERTKLSDGSAQVVVETKLDLEDMERKRTKKFERDMALIENEFQELAQTCAIFEQQLERRAETDPETLPKFEEGFLKIFAEFSSSMAESPLAPLSDDDDLDSDSDSDRKRARLSCLSHIQIKDTLPLLPFNKRVAISRDGRKKIEKSRWRHKLKYGSLDTWTCPPHLAPSDSSTKATASACLPIVQDTDAERKKIEQRQAQTHEALRQFAAANEKAMIAFVQKLPPNVAVVVQEGMSLKRDRDGFSTLCNGELMGPPLTQLRTMMNQIPPQPFLPGEVVILEPIDVEKCN